MQCKGLFGGPIFVVGVQDIEVSQHEGVNASSFSKTFSKPRRANFDGFYTTQKAK